jgi:N6-L-threonylcarbamoyladenine synthase
MITLGIETSCDETAAAIIENENKILSHVISSQIELHAQYGGIVPEIASRKHLECIIFVIKKALDDAKMKLSDIDIVAVTKGPGLIGSLLVGIEFAKSIAYVTKSILIGINHLEAHLFSALLEHKIKFPAIGAIVSGGHTELVLWKDYFEFEHIARTKDDAAGESFDKVAKLLGYSYPGGPVIEKLASKIENVSIKIPQVKIKDKSYDFSFSGLKTAAIYKVKENKNTKEEIAKWFQTSVVENIVSRIIKVSEERNISTIVLAGGVAANSFLQNELISRARNKNINVIIPSLQFCMDNAAMVAITGYFRVKFGYKDGWDLTAQPSLKIGE